MEHITHNPHSDEPPNYNSAAFALVQTTLMVQNNTDEGANQLLLDAWKQDNDRLKEAWDAQAQDNLRIQEVIDLAACE